MSDQPEPTTPPATEPPKPNIFDSFTEEQAEHIRHLLAYCYVRGYNDNIVDSQSVIRRINAEKLSKELWALVNPPATTAIPVEPAPASTTDSIQSSNDSENDC